MPAKTICHLGPRRGDLPTLILDPKARRRSCMQTCDFDRVYYACVAKAKIDPRGHLMADRSFLAWPFFDDHHRDLAEKLDSWCATNLPVAHDDVDTACRSLVTRL